MNVRDYILVSSLAYDGGHMKKLEAHGHELIGIFSVESHEDADLLVSGVSNLPTAPSTKLRNSEVHSLFLANINTTGRTSPEHSWSAAECLGLSLQCFCSKFSQITLSRLRTGHIKSLIFNGNEKTYAACRCFAIASPSHILYCIEASVRHLLNEVNVGFDFIVRHGLQDLV
ncbi:RNase H domain-containing protein [Nephila pilipes]|uniref:RNase H domain-containing protein n=1 Tax=Nephila pilipes TaxID=299642 RepID=A0A8X6IFK7_NEPPI|nr:RNase H domain-containing protein [Nephila pilipes]